MGLIKAVIILSTSIVGSDMFLRLLKKNKSRTFIKQLEPNLNNRLHIIILIMVLLMILM